jgi:fibronectin type 3 domain-containing protein
MAQTNLYLRVNYMKYLGIFLLVFCLPAFVFAAPLEPGLVLEVKSTAEAVKLRWLVTDKRFDYTYVLSRAAAKTPDKKQEIARLKMADFAKAKTILGDNEAALKLMFPFKAAKSQAEKNQSLAQNDNRLNMLLYLSVMEPSVATALGQYYEDSPPAYMKAVLYTLEVYRRGELVHTKTRGIAPGIVRQLPMLWDVQAHRFDWGVGLKWQGYEPYTAFNIYRSGEYDGEYTKINTAPVQVQVSRNENGTIDVAPYFYSDTKLKKGELAFYQIQGVDFFADSGPETIPVLGMVKIELRPAPLRRPEMKSGETSISMSWEPSPDKDIVGYNIYRTRRYEGKGEKLNDGLIAGTSFTDENVKVDLNYFYSVTAVNKGGYESLPSLNGQGLAKDATPPPTAQKLAAEVIDAKVNLHWHGVQAEDLLGYRIYRTMNENDQDWALLNNDPVVNTAFIDVLAKNLSRYPYYYRITSVDTRYNESDPSAFVKIKLPDVTPPKSPSISGSSVRAGQVALTWDQIQSYDLAGFYVYREVAGQKLKVSPNLLINPSFVDANPPVDKPIIYTVVAVDETGNESEPSSTVNLSVRDHVKPQISSFKAGVTKGEVVLTVVSKDTDLAGFDIFRSHNNRDFLKISHARIDESQFVDARVKKGKRYFYKVVLWDQAANKTESTVREVRVPR